MINKKVTIFSITYFLGIFGIGLTFKSLEKVISLEEDQKKIYYSEYLMKVLLRQVIYFKSWLLK